MDGRVELFKRDATNKERMSEVSATYLVKHGNNNNEMNWPLPTIHTTFTKPTINYEPTRRSKEQVTAFNNFYNVGKNEWEFFSFFLESEIKLLFLCFKDISDGKEVDMEWMFVDSKFF